MVLGKGTAKQAKRSFKGKGVGGFRGIVRFWEEWCGNPSGSRPNFFGRQHLTFDKGGKDMVRGEGCCPFAMVVGIERFDATGRARKASD